MENWQHIEPRKLLELLNAEQIRPEQIIDVREWEEWEYYHISGTLLMPTSTFIERCLELASDDDLYIVCAHGVRSVAVCRYLSSKGYERLYNVSGGMAAVAEVLGFQYD